MKVDTFHFDSIPESILVPAVPVSQRNLYRLGHP
jgi:hypothetical protein